MSGVDIVKALRDLADSMEAHKMDPDLVHRLSVELVAIDLNLSAANPPDGMFRGLSTLLAELVEHL